jgi:hypothetical protein
MKSNLSDKLPSGSHVKILLLPLAYAATAACTRTFATMQRNPLPHRGIVQPEREHAAAARRHGGLTRDGADRKHPAQGRGATPACATGRMAGSTAGGVRSGR